MWLLFAFASALFLGFYDVFKKKALMDNAVIPVLFLNTLFCSLVFLPFLLLSNMTNMLDDTIFHMPAGWHWETQKYILLKSCIVLCSWVFGYYAMKHLPLTMVGPINATRPVMTLLGALIIFGESLNTFQWTGVLIAVVSFGLLSRSGKKEGIDFTRNRWVFALVISVALGAVSGLYDKYLLASSSNGGVNINRMLTQSWFNIYQCFMMLGVLLPLWRPKRKETTRFHWSWSIVGISIFISVADFVYFYSLSIDGAMISIVSMIRRGSVVVSFLLGAMLFREKNLKYKAFDLLLVLISMIFLYWGSR